MRIGRTKQQQFRQDTITIESKLHSSAQRSAAQRSAAQRSDDEARTTTKYSIGSVTVSIETSRIRPLMISIPSTCTIYTVVLEYQYQFLKHITVTANTYQNNNSSSKMSAADIAELEAQLAQLKHIQATTPR